MDKENKKDYLNSLAKKVLSDLGNSKPDKHQIRIIKKLISTVSIEYQVLADHRLSEQEANCLLLAAKGMTSQESAALLNITANTVETHRKKIKTKLACNSIAQAVYEGFRLGYVKPEIGQ